MLALARFQFQHVNKPPSVFPPLVGSHRKIKTDTSTKQSPPKNLTPPRRQQELNFLNRMKKAREVIFSHQRTNKILMEKNNKLVERAKTDNTERIYKNLQQKGFSQVVYNLGPGPKKIIKKDSIDNQKFNDKILRECKSSFMPNEREKIKYYLKIPKKHLKTQRNQFKNHPRSMFFNHNSEQRVHQESKKKIESTEKYLLQHLFPQDVMSSNGQQLVQKLKKCREEKENPQLIIKKQDKQNDQEAEEEIQEAKETNYIQFPYAQGKTKGKSKYLHRMQEKNNRKIKISWQTPMKSTKEERPSQDEQEQNKGHSSHLSKKAQDQSRRKQKQRLKNQSKSAYFDENFKISAWNEQQMQQSEIF